MLESIAPCAAHFRPRRGQVGSVAAWRSECQAPNLGARSGWTAGADLPYQPIHCARTHQLNSESTGRDTLALGRRVPSCHFELAPVEIMVHTHSRFASDMGINWLDPSARTPCVVQVGQPVAKAWLTVQQRGSRLLGHAAVAVGAAGDNCLGQSAPALWWPSRSTRRKATACAPAIRRRSSHASSNCMPACTAGRCAMRLAQARRWGRSANRSISVLRST